MKKKQSITSKLINELEHLQQADNLLTKIWLELGGPYGGKLPIELQSELNDYMKFDDSE